MVGYAVSSNLMNLYAIAIFDSCPQILPFHWKRSCRSCLCRSHNFLNQKPWHPLNFRNQMKVFEAQEQAEKEAKARAQGKVISAL